MNVIAVAVIPLIVALAGVVIALSERSDRRLREQMSEMKSRFDGVDQRSERMDDRLTALERHMNDRFSKLERHMTDRFDRVDARIDRLYDRSA